MARLAIAKRAGAPSRPGPESLATLAKRYQRSLYVCRKLANAEDVIAWAKSVGFPTTIVADQMHVTIAFSRGEVDWDALDDAASEVRVPASSRRSLASFGEDGKAIVLAFASPELRGRWKEIREAGGTWDFPDFKPHVTLSWNGLPEDLDLTDVAPYSGELIFGPEHLREVVDDWHDDVVEKAVPGERFESYAKVAGVDDELGIVFGWAMVCKTAEGVDYFDLHGDNISEFGMIEALADFMENSRVAKIQHAGEQQGTVLFAFPMTHEIGKALGVSSDFSGAIIGWKPADKALLEGFRDGTYTGFSIGGYRISDTLIED